MEMRDVPLEIATEHDTKCSKRDKRAKRDKRDKRAKRDKRDKRAKRDKRDKRDKNRDLNLRHDRFLKKMNFTPVELMNHLAGFLDQRYQRMFSLESEQEEYQWWECDEYHNFGANLPSAEQERLRLEAEGHRNRADLPRCLWLMTNDEESDDEGSDDWKNCQDPTCRWPNLCQLCY